MSKKSNMTGRSLLKPTMALVLAIAIGAVAATAGSATTTTRSGALHVTKECVGPPPYDGDIGDYCTITSSNIPLIKPGMKVVYLRDAEGAGLDGDLALGSGKGTALGHVVIDLETGTGRVSFSVGTGRFSRFRASAVVSPGDELGSFRWDGRYKFARSDDRHDD
jgi:hypothetical protein